MCSLSSYGHFFVVSLLDNISFELRYSVGLYIDSLDYIYLSGLLELEESLPDILLRPVVKAPKRQMTTSAGFLKRKYRDEKQLADIHQASCCLYIMCTMYDCLIAL